MKSKMKVVVVENGEDKTNYLFGVDPRKIRVVYNSIEMFHDKFEDDGTGKVVKTSEYCADKEKMGFGWAEMMKPKIQEILETERAFVPENKSEPEILVDAICCDDQMLQTFMWGDKDRKIDGYFQTCRESRVKLS